MCMYGMCESERVSECLLITSLYFNRIEIISLKFMHSVLEIKRERHKRIRIS